MQLITRRILPFFPSAPRGANMFARYVVYHCLSASDSIMGSKLTLFGDSQARAIDPFGASLSKVAQVAPEQVFPLDELLEVNTLFGFYSAVLSPERKQAWRKNQLAAQARLLNKFVTGQTGFRLTKPCLHFCKECVAEDEKNYGIGYWRLIHQVPGVNHCPTHALTLSGICQQCLTAAGAEIHWFPPSNRCPHCGGRSFKQTTIHDCPAYHRFVELVDLATKGCDVGLERSERVELYSSFCPSSALPSVHDGDLDNLVNVVLLQWNMAGLELLESTLEAQMNRQFIRQAIAGQDHVVNPVGHLAIISALRLANSTKPTQFRNAHKVENDVQPLNEEFSKILQTHHIAPQDVVLALKHLADQHGLPEQVGMMLLDKVSRKKILKHFCLGAISVRHFFNALKNLEVLNNLPLQPEKITRISLSQILDEIKQLRLRDKHRAILLRVVEERNPTRPALRKLASNSVCWCVKHDEHWLAAICPPATEEEKRATCRGTIHSALNSGLLTRESIRLSNSKAYMWCFKFDRAWLDATIPSQQRYKGLSHEEMRTRCRSIVTDAAAAGVKDQRHLPPGARIWCIEHDQGWLDMMLPRSNFALTKRRSVESER